MSPEGKIFALLGDGRISYLWEILSFHGEFLGQGRLRSHYLKGLVPWCRSVSLCTMNGRGATCVGSLARCLLRFILEGPEDQNPLWDLSLMEDPFRIQKLLLHAKL